MFDAGEVVSTNLVEVVYKWRVTNSFKISRFAGHVNRENVIVVVIVREKPAILSMNSIKREYQYFSRVFITRWELKDLGK